MNNSLVVEQEYNDPGTRISNDPRKAGRELMKPKLELIEFSEQKLIYFNFPVVVSRIQTSDSI